MPRIPPTEGVLYVPGNDWLGRGPVVKKGYEKYHAGLDIFNRGRLVVAPENGRVVFAVSKEPPGASIVGGYGPGIVAIDGESGVFHWLAHLKNPIVQRNQEVIAGQTVALGTTDHVHWEIRQELIPYKNAKYWPWVVTIDPYRWLFHRELTAMDAINWVKTQLYGEEYKESTKRMELLRRPMFTAGEKIYPIGLRWKPEMKKAITEGVVKILDARKRKHDRQLLNIAAGVFLGTSFLLATLG